VCVGLCERLVTVAVTVVSPLYGCLLLCSFVRSFGLTACVPADCDGRRGGGGR